MNFTELLTTQVRVMNDRRAIFARPLLAENDLSNLSVNTNPRNGRVSASHGDRTQSTPRTRRLSQQRINSPAGRPTVPPSCRPHLTQSILTLPQFHFTHPQPRRCSSSHLPASSTDIYLLNTPSSFIRLTSMSSPRSLPSAHQHTAVRRGED
ncbi:hypothetical protein E2C01_059998 [Portunus trituberculatus]|uniref:Uncharacterized protein n=1 Tax=Portunus trituberculatus TaxID=210409 RepID=A0A5B7GZU6_PORTR|nr:hypothetical protein [Portunus trituberculatus]